MIDPCPPSGRGVHHWLMQAGWMCRLSGMNATETARYLRDHMTRYPNPRGEVEQAVEKIFGEPATTRKHEAEFRSSRWPDVDHERRAEIAASGAGLSDLWELSPEPRVDSEPHTEEIVDALLPGDPLLCCGESSRRFATRRRSEWRGRLSGLQLIVPSPMSAVSGKTQDGRDSQHTLANTGPRRFLVIEQDAGSLDEQAAVLVHLASLAPLAAAIQSGSKSLHGWFFCAGRPEESLLRFMRYAVRLGADRATWTRSQFVRMPDGTREGGARQAVYFLNPGVVK